MFHENVARSSVFVLKAGESIRKLTFVKHKPRLHYTSQMDWKRFTVFQHVHFEQTHDKLCALNHELEFLILNIEINGVDQLYSFLLNVSYVGFEFSCAKRNSSSVINIITEDFALICCCSDLFSFDTLCYFLNCNSKFFVTTSVLSCLRR